MKIYSNFRDPAIDALLASGVDEDVVWDRNQRMVDISTIPSDIQAPLLPRLPYTIPNLGGKLDSWVFVGYCGMWHYFASTYRWTHTRDKGDSPQLEEFTPVLSPVEDHRLFQFFKAPVLVVEKRQIWGRSKNLTINPNMGPQKKDGIWYHPIFPVLKWKTAQEVWMDVSAYLSNHIHSSPATVQVTDKTKIVKAGFDIKTSFRGPR